jgi:hypothetical protein
MALEFTASTGVLPQDQALLSAIRRKVQEGMSLMRKERAFNEIQRGIDFVSGEQAPLKSNAISKTVDNRSRKILLETVSALTDVRPIWNYETENEKFKEAAETLSRLARGWWRNNNVDMALQAILSYACVGGSGYGALVWDADLPGGGDLRLVPFDPRDVIPIDPTYTGSIQEWGGVVLHQRIPLDAAKQMWPTKKHLITPSNDAWFDTQSGTAKRPFDIVSAAWNMISRTGAVSSMDTPDYVDIYRVFTKDYSTNTSGQRLKMGAKSWEYEVPSHGALDELGRPTLLKEARIYPRGRMVVCTPTAILEDGPNPYWHGLFPVIRFTLDPLPWSLLGAPIVSDMIPMQNALNESIRGLEDGMAQWVRRAIIADRTAMSRSNLDALDTRKPGLKALVNPTAGEGFKIQDGPQFPEWYMEYITYLKNEMDELSGVRGLQQMSQLKQMPSAEVMDRIQEALSPILRMRSRNIECGLAELAEMLKAGFFQFYTSKRRMQVLGRDGVSLENFTYEPSSLTGGLTGKEATEAAQLIHKDFIFSIAPNSFLNVSHATQKMLILQLLRSQLVDPWTAWETMDVPNAGQAPAETIPERITAARKLGLMPGPTPEMVQAQQAQMLMQTQLMMGQMGMQMMMGGQGPPQGGPEGGGAPPTPPPNNSGVGPQGGRPPSGGQPPQFVQKDGGARTVVSESGA